MGRARYPLLRRHQASGSGAPSVINSSRIMSRSRSTPRVHDASLSLSLLLSIQTTDPIQRSATRTRARSRRLVVVVVAAAARSWNFHESRGDGKIRGRWKIQQPPAPPPPPPSEHPWPTPHSENAWEALPGAPFIAGLAEGRRRARRAAEGDVGGGWGAGNLIANTFHGPANFKPISSVYCQSQRARNSSLSARNEILPVVPFRRSPCPFDLHWRRLGNLRDTTLSRYSNERCTVEIYDDGSRLAVPPRFTYLSMRFAQLDHSADVRAPPMVTRGSKRSGSISGSFIVAFLHRSYPLRDRADNPSR